MYFFVNDQKVNHGESAPGHQGHHGHPGRHGQHPHHVHHPNRGAHDTPFAHDRHLWAFDRHHNHHHEGHHTDPRNQSMHHEIKETNKNNNEEEKTKLKESEDVNDDATADSTASKKARRESVQEESMVEPITIEKDEETSIEKPTPDILPLFPSYFHPPLALPKIPKLEVTERPESGQSYHQEKDLASPAAEEMLIPPPLLPSPFRGLGGTPPFLDEQALLDPRHIIQLLTRKVGIFLDFEILNSKKILYKFTRR